jgi:N-methylhydantoinase B/oxoprolinase/acetone carboxylase alpha subunit
VERDVIEGYVSLEKAKEDYRVVVDPNTMKVNHEETRKRREILKKTL